MEIIIGIICFFFFCGIFACPSAAEQKKKQEQIEHTREVALARMLDYLNKKLNFNNQQATWRTRITKDQFVVNRSDISNLVPEFIEDCKLREMVWRKGFSFQRISGTQILFVKIPTPSDSEKYVDLFY